MTDDKQEQQLEAMQQFDVTDDMAIVAAQQGKSLCKMVYDIPFKDKSGRSSKNCGVPTCKLNGKEAHNHVRGVGIEGINEILRHMGGINLRTLENENGDKVTKVMVNNKYYLRATAVAQDLFTGTEREATYHFPIDSRRYEMLQKTGNEHYALTITQSGAERNAARKLLDQAALFNMTEIAREGRTEFSVGDVKRIFGPMYQERLALKKMYFEASIKQKLALGGSPSPRRMLEATAEVVESEPVEEKAKKKPAAKPRKKAAEKPKPDAGEENGSTEVSEAQKTALVKLLGKAGAPEEAIKSYIEEKCATRGEASVQIGLLQDGNNEDYAAWAEGKMTKDPETGEYNW